MIGYILGTAGIWVINGAALVALLYGVEWLLKRGRG